MLNSMVSKIWAILANLSNLVRRRIRIAFNDDNAPYGTMIVQ